MGFFRWLAMCMNGQQVFGLQGQNIRHICILTLRTMDAKIGTPPLKCFVLFVEVHLISQAMLPGVLLVVGTDQIVPDLIPVSGLSVPGCKNFRKRPSNNM
jgi:hypothetical protein